MVKNFKANHDNNMLLLNLVEL